MTNDLLKRRAIIVLGKGGVGKTTVAAAFASLAADNGARVLLMECDSHGPIAALFGLKRSFEPLPAASNLWVMILDGRRSLEEYLHLVLPGRAVLKAVFASRLYQYFVQAAPGLRELMMLGKLCYEVESIPSARAPWDQVVVDGPASGQALNLLRMPIAARETFGESIVGREAQSIMRMLRDKRLCAIIQVTTPDPLSHAETMETNAALAALGLEVAAVVLNRRNPAAFDRQDVARFAGDHDLRRRLKTLGHLCSLAHAELERAAASGEALARLKERIGSPIIELGEYGGRSGLELMKALATELRRQCVAGDDPSAAHAQRPVARL